MKSISSFFSRYSDFDIVFFDLFDTIITRRVHPEFVKKLAAKKLCLYFGFSNTPDAIYEVRRHLEKKLCDDNANNGFDPEFNFDCFTSEFYLQLLSVESARMATVDKVAFARLCREIELDVELSVQEIDPECIKFISKLKETGVSLGCISDFYFSESMMRELFSLQGIDGYFDHLYVSGQYLITKRSGRLYEKVIADLSLQPDRVLMIGDNEHSDNLMARTKGLHTYLVERAEKRKFYDDFWAFVHNRKAIDKAFDRIVRSATSGGKEIFSDVSASLYLFIKKLHEELMSRGVRDVFFLSREGEFLKELFDDFQLIHGYSPSFTVRSHYVLASRKSTYLPSLGPLAQEKFSALFRQYRTMSLYEFLSSLNFSPVEISAIAIELSIDPNVSESDFPTSGLYRRLITNPLFASTYESLRMEQKYNFIRYLDDFKSDIDKDGINLVDVGWKGTIQNNIFGIFDGTRQINGFYLGYLGRYDACNDNFRNNKTGLLFSLTETKSKYFDIYDENKSLFEVVLGASHGGPQRYEDNGCIHVSTLHEEGEEILFSTTIRPLQESIKRLFSQLCELDCKLHYDSSCLERYAAKRHARLVFLPREAELSFFRRIFHYENFGVFRKSRFDMQTGLVSWFRTANALVRNPLAVLYSAWWPVLTLKVLGFEFLRYPYGMYRYYHHIIRNKRDL